MIFIVTYKDDIEAVFFHTWDAQQHLNRFDKEEQNQMKILKVDEQKANLQNLKETLQNCIIDTTDHCCGNCGRTLWDKGIFLCSFTKEETNPNDYCIHYI